jgi:hypothetical protein
MTRIAVCVANVAALISMADQRLWSQESPPVHASGFCMKVLPGKGAEFERHLTDVSRKLAQVSVNEGRMSAWMVSRAVVPAGDEAGCDYVIQYFYSGPPPKPADTADTEARLKKAGLKMTAQQLQAQRASLYKLAGHRRMVRSAGFGTIEKGDYYHANYMKARPGKEAEFHQFELKVWLPAAEAAAKEGHPRKAWGAWHVLYPSGTATRFDDITTDIFRDWDSIWKPQSFPQAIWDRVAPGKTLTELGAQITSLRDLTSNQLFVVTDLIRAPGAGAAKPSGKGR